jgi:sec-independent protein translocase protein TatC
MSAAGDSGGPEIIDFPWPHDGYGYPGLEDLPADPSRLAEEAALSEDPPDPDPANRRDAAASSASRLPAAAGEKTTGDPLWNEMGGHLEELRRRLAVSLAIFLPFFAFGLWLYQELWAAIKLPLERAAPHLLRFQALNPSDGLVMAMRIAFAFAAFLSLPVWLSQIWCFVAPGLTAGERRWLHLCLGTGGVLFAGGALIAYFAGVPLALAWLLPFNQSLEGWENAFTGAGYVDFVLTCSAGFGLAFELPLLMLALGWTGILTPENLRAGWRGAVLAIFILAALLTPPDPFTQMLLALPLLFLFGAGYWLVVWSSRRRGI